MNNCFWCRQDCQRTCLKLTTSTQMTPSDPNYGLLSDDYITVPVVYRESCYICRDPEYAQMGLPLCRLCSKCSVGHVPADDSVCDDCGHDNSWVSPENFFEYATNSPDWSVAQKGDCIIALDLRLTDDLIAEGKENDKRREERRKNSVAFRENKPEERE